MNVDRPIIKLRLTPTDQLLEMLCVVPLLFMWGYAFFQYRTLPGRIPIHFDLDGQVNGWGSRDSLWLLPLIGTVIYGGLSWLNRYPHIFNYPATLTAANAEQHYRIATRMIRVLKCVIVFIFAFLLFEIVQGARHRSLPYQGWELPLILGAVLGPVIYFMWKAGRV